MRRGRNPAQAIEILTAMLEFFDGGRRWLRGRMATSDGNRCLVGAFLHVEKLPWTPAADDNPAIAYLFRALPEPYRHVRFRHPDPIRSPLRTLAYFNDCSGNYSSIGNLIERARALALAEIAERACKTEIRASA
jgi:hypothetical protein